MAGFILFPHVWWACFALLCIFMCLNPFMSNLSPHTYIHILLCHIYIYIIYTLCVSRPQAQQTNLQDLLERIRERLNQGNAATTTTITPSGQVIDTIHNWRLEDHQTSVSMNCYSNDLHYHLYLTFLSLSVCLRVSETRLDKRRQWHMDGERRERCFLIKEREAFILWMNNDV